MTSPSLSSAGELQPSNTSWVIASPGSSTTSTPSFSARWAKSLDELQSFTPIWSELADNSVWRNPTFEPNFLLPALRHLADDSVRVLVVEANFANERSKQVVAIVPTTQKKIYGLPIPAVEVWRHDMSFDGTPLIHKDYAQDILRAIFKFLKEQEFGLLSLDTVSADAEFDQPLRQAISQLNLSVFNRDRFSRPTLKPSHHFDAYMNQFTSKSVRKNFRRMNRRLGELGQVQWSQSNSSSSFRELSEEFKTLEAAGWKGNNRTAIKNDPSTQHFFDEMIEASANSGKVRFLKLSVDGKTVAMLCDLQSGQNVYCYKTAFDERFAAYSPGHQAEIQNINWLHESQIQMADSCVEPTNPSFDRIWNSQLDFQHTVIGLKPGTTQWAVRGLPFVQSFFRRARQVRDVCVG